MLRAGAACLDITPPLGAPLRGFFHERRARAVHDPLYVRSLALEQDGAGIAIAICDLIGVRRAYLDRARARITEMLGLAPEQVLIACTHTHTGPETGDDPYTEFLIARIADAVTLAWDRRIPAEAGWGRAGEPRVAFNRRYRMRDGTVQTNPGIGNPDVVEPAGPIDPEVGVLCLRRPDGHTLGLLANYALHYVGTPDAEYAISADYFGLFSQLIQRLRDEAFVAALCNGASADINNIDVLGGRRPPNDRYQHVERVAALIAAAALWAWNEMPFVSAAPIGAALAEVAVRRREPPSEADATRAQQIEARLAAGERVLMGERAFARRVLRQMRNLPAELSTWVQALRVGDLALVGVPGELFVELGLEIKRRSPFGQTMVIELANDSIGYIPTRRAFEEGGYEPEASVLAPGEGERIVETALALLEQLRQK
jgi:neutral ceramidase